MLTSPTPFYAHVGTLNAAAGLSLRGNCNSGATARQLEQAVTELLRFDLPHAWVDCQRLESLSWQGQRAIYNAHQAARLAGVTLHWCGMSALVLAQLAENGLHLLLNLEPAASYRGPATLRQPLVPHSLRTHGFPIG